MYHEAGLPGAEPILRARVGVLSRLLLAVDFLPAEMGLRVSDAYRPLVVQQALWDSLAGQTRVLNPDWTDDEVNAYTGRFVARPQFNPLQPPPHLTGGAVDVALVWLADGSPVDVGTAMDDAHELSLTVALEGLSLSEAARNRRILYHAMIGAGFVNYPNEWWHYEFGTIRWAKQTGASVAIYGGIQ